MFFKKNKAQPPNTNISSILGNKFDRGKNREPSYIAPDMTFEGNIITDGEVHIEGQIHGNVRAHTCLVESKGEVLGGILAEIVVVRGRVNGPIAAKQLTIQKGAHVEGNVQHGSINIENGAYVAGMVTQIAPEEVNHQAKEVPALSVPQPKSIPQPKKLINIGSNIFDKK